MAQKKSKTKTDLKDKQKIKELEKQLRMMKKENELAQLKAEAYKTMIEVAEEEFNIKTVPVGSEKSLEPDSQKTKNTLSTQRTSGALWIVWLVKVRVL